MPDRTLRRNNSAAPTPSLARNPKDPTEQSTQQHAGNGTNSTLNLRIRFQRVQNHHPQQQGTPTHNGGQNTDVMIQEAARIAMQRSQARTVVCRTPSGRAIKGPSPSPPEVQQTLETARHQRPRKVHSEIPVTGTAGTGVLSKLKLTVPSTIIAGLGKKTVSAAKAAVGGGGGGVGSGESEEPRQREGEQAQQKPKPNPEPERKDVKDEKEVVEEEETEGDDDDHMDAVGALSHVLQTLLGLALGLARAWWREAVWPAFDARGEVRRRRREHRSEWRDVRVFASAGVFCLACAWAGAGVLSGGVGTPFRTDEVQVRDARNGNEGSGSGSALPLRLHMRMESVHYGVIGGKWL
ncbi:hypothetical protein F4810DRAFT_714076 [Camillea tinctor]|nr:hypothetical protein F4810DRAFT_714076 [Camillea tinctor]